MSATDVLRSERFPRASGYHPDWVLSGVSGGANPLWLMEWLTEDMDLQPGMRVLDLGCGRALSSIFLCREFGVEVWAADLWFSPEENLLRAQDAGVGDGVFPLRADARKLPFQEGFFDVVVSADAFMYFGTDDLYLNYLLRFVKPGGVIAISLSGVKQEIDDLVPDHLKEWWEADNPYVLHSAEWWRRHWKRSGLVDILFADSLPDGWKYWLEWLRLIAPDNSVEIKTLEKDEGRCLGYVRAIAKKRPDVQLIDTSLSLPEDYIRRPLRRD